MQHSAFNRLLLVLLVAGTTNVPSVAAQVDAETIPPEAIVSPHAAAPSTPTTQAEPTTPQALTPSGQMQTMPPQGMMGGRPSRVNWTAPGQAPTLPSGASPPAGSSALLNQSSGSQALMQQPGAQLQPGGSAQGGAFGPNTDDDCPGCPKKKGYKEHYYPSDAPQPPAAFNAGPVHATTPGQIHKDPLAVIETTKGTIVIRLFRQHAPKTVANFIDVSSHGFYNSLLFHRVEPGFVVQSGCPNGNGTGGYTDPHSGQVRRLGLELNPRLRHNAPGVVAMARTGNDPHSASSQFYITLSEQGRLDNKYAVFGGVIKGMDVVQRITTQDRIITVSVQEQE